MDIPEVVFKEASGHLLRELANHSDREIADRAIAELHARKAAAYNKPGKNLVLTMPAKLVVKVKAPDDEQAKAIISNELLALVGRYGEIDITPSDPRIRSINFIIDGKEIKDAQVDIDIAE